MSMEKMKAIQIPITWGFMCRMFLKKSKWRHQGGYQNGTIEVGTRFKKIPTFLVLFIASVKIFFLGVKVMIGGSA